MTPSAQLNYNILNKDSQGFGSGDTEKFFFKRSGTTLESDLKCGAQIKTQGSETKEFCINRIISRDLESLKENFGFNLEKNLLLRKKLMSQQDSNPGGTPDVQPNFQNSGNHSDSRSNHTRCVSTYGTGNQSEAVFTNKNLSGQATANKGFICLVRNKKAGLVENQILGEKPILSDKEQNLAGGQTDKAYCQKEFKELSRYKQIMSGVYKGGTGELSNKNIDLKKYIRKKDAEGIGETKLVMGRNAWAWENFEGKKLDRGFFKSKKDRSCRDKVSGAGFDGEKPTEKPVKSKFQLSGH
jgi:hypothetical protein